MAPHAIEPTTPESEIMLNGHAPTSVLTNGIVHQSRTATQEEYDLVCVGFGPANLALAIALRDTFEHTSMHAPTVKYLEKQTEFAWHAGMLLPGTKMQIHFMKDLATFRNPKSHFTFVNYLFEHNRLAGFTDMGTNLPSRFEYQDYMKWCASHFADQVHYGAEIQSIAPNLVEGTSKPARSFTIVARDVQTGSDISYIARNVVVGVGGQPNIPSPFPVNKPNVIHSSRYRQQIGIALPKTNQPYRIAVVGSGQSAAEIFHDLHSRYPNASTRLIFRSRALRPSDDSPFVNEIFHPTRVDEFYSKPDAERESTISEDKSTNYSVVRLPLLEQLHEMLYTQRIREPDETKWQHRILPERTVDECNDEGGRILLKLGHKTDQGSVPENFECDAVIIAAGYQRNMHEEMLGPCKTLMSLKGQDGCKVSRDYRVEFDQGRIANDAGVWLQGCNESTHGLSDTLLSILASRAGELLTSIFGKSEVATT